MGPMNRIVVGIDGSDASRSALEWAVREARLRGAEVDAVYMWADPAVGYKSGFLAPLVNARHELVADSQKRLHQICESVDAHDVVVNRVIEEGPAARRLLDAAEGADLLVVGSRGRGGFTGLLLGSVGQQCAHHATCPVVIVR